MIYFNEFDPFAAQWLRNLIDAGHLPAGVVDGRDVREVMGDELRPYRRCHFFAGIAGWELALRLAGWPESRPVWTASLPCQPFSSAGKRKGQADSRHLWPVFLRLVRECRPDCLFGEQVASDDGCRWLARVCDDLEEEGYAVGCAALPACCAGAPHIRERLFWVAHAAGRGRGAASGAPGVSGGRGDSGRLADAEGHRRDEQPGVGGVAKGARLLHGRQPDHDGRVGFWSDCEWLPCADGKARRTQPGLFPLAHGVSGRVAVPRPGVEAESAVQGAEEVRWVSRAGALRGFGNAIVPQTAALFVRAFLEATEEVTA